MRTGAPDAFNFSCLSRPGTRVATVVAVAPPVTLYCRNRSFLENQESVLDIPLESLALYGLPTSRQDSEVDYARYRQSWPSVQPKGVFGVSPSSQLPASTFEIPEAKSLVYNSGKLARLDTLLQELKRGDHRVLIYSQMTRMLDLMEEYLIYRQYKYLRLDGSTKMEDRRDMVIEWQTRLAPFC
jgi:chromatin-remodeling ATPase INO80